ncbi:MAG: single-stranded DNA-binding protein [Chloroflexi bacterium]|nr:single-stranded DNA-binding protein [Chloroflexota bacterium]
MRAAAPADCVWQRDEDQDDCAGEERDPGEPLYTEGRPRYRSFQDGEGKERGVSEVIADDMQFLRRRGNENWG